MNTMDHILDHKSKNKTMFILKVSNGVFGMETIFKTHDKQEMDKMKAIADEIWNRTNIEVVEYKDTVGGDK